MNKIKGEIIGTDLNFDSNKKDKILGVRVSSIEFTQFEKIAIKQNLSKSELLKKLIDKEITKK